jgi:hypothetical protein
VAYKLNCDVEACGAEIASGPGQPGLVSRERVFCNRCAGYVESVEAQLHREAVTFAVEGATRLAARRQELMAQMLPQSLGGNGQGTEGWKVG